MQFRTVALNLQIFGSAMTRRRTGSKDRNGISFQATLESTWQVGSWLDIARIFFSFLPVTVCRFVCMFTVVSNLCLLLGEGEELGELVSSAWHGRAEWKEDKPV